VNLLKSVLAEARVGTIDKFQGQEAEVVLVSMATSSGDYLPRNIEFLYDKNRLNVAISRAKCLAVVVASPQLLHVKCGTAEEMELVNTLCWVEALGAAHADDDGDAVDGGDLQGIGQGGGPVGGDCCVATYGRRRRGNAPNFDPS
jgi:uncharacterized protein